MDGARQSASAVGADLAEPKTHSDKELFLLKRKNLRNPLVSLKAVNQSIMAHREDTWADGRRTQNAYRKLHGAVHCVAKTCTKFSDRLGELSARIVSLETESEAEKTTTDMLETGVSDAHWKLEDFDNRLRKNNLRVLGIPEVVEGAEGEETSKFIVRLSFPELSVWN
ncbi:hypothetical protein NDU88_004289 [Pleurodeles waltl]|uniref:Uncharacterized protein n=1 Tax=Pleurodeles waltl TaxID=8319 RepID=A0AAV7TQV6_PLEWA|nr:hypothetical protein NDU88_004289 [Pleurodeles waltl]